MRILLGIQYAQIEGLERKSGVACQGIHNTYPAKQRNHYQISVQIGELKQNVRHFSEIKNVKIEPICKMCGFLVDLKRS